ncbi:MAG TPA: alpha/beta hydrolase [Ohtaekwangia sp.]|uniref:alpha/beta hydrolase n=1 Tax=Ohtaekwangia sp. TaxID=2066019 RepID=UPI002F94CA6E
MEQQTLSFTCQARYFQLGTITPSTRQVWFVLHGYGQLAQYFIQKFKVLQEHNICVIAPEALSRFYLEDVTSRMQTGNNRVGATWMTKENREMDIQNYVVYLNTLYHHVMASASAIPVTMLGFSQGSATISRWVTDEKVNFQRLILWAGIFPPDMNIDESKRVLHNKETYIVYGKSDPFLNDSRFAEMNTIASSLAITPQVITFDGKHDIDSSTLLKFI